METPPKKLFIFQEKTFGGQKLWEKELSSFKVKKLMFQKELTKSGNQKFSTFSLRNKQNFPN